MSDPVPAIPEAEATGETAEIFADIRATYRIGVVNLIWRHLAHFEGALPWAWASVKPLYVSGHVAAAAAALRAERPLPEAPRVPEAAWACIGLDAQPVRDVIAAYDRSNPMALAALTLLRESTEPGFAAEGTPRAPHFPDEAPIPLPALLDLDSMPRHAAGMVLVLNAMGSTAERPILASMYRHMAHWPGALALAHGVLAPLHARGELQQAIAATRELARTEAQRMAGLLPRLPPPPDLPRVKAALDAFIQDAIARMVVNGGVLGQAFRV
jgi:hypothetical protein